MQNFRMVSESEGYSFMWWFEFSLMKYYAYINNEYVLSEEKKIPEFSQNMNAWEL